MRLSPLVSPRADALIGLTGGVFNFVGGPGGITVPLVIGYLAQDYGFGPALVYISVVALIGALSYILLVGDETCRLILRYATLMRKSRIRVSS